MKYDDNNKQQQEIDEILVLMKVLYNRLQQTNLLKAEDREHLAYQTGEIVLACKKLYTEVTPFLATPESQKSECLFDFMVELRMNLLNLKDLIEDFEDSFMGSLTEPLETEKTSPGEGLNLN